MGKPEKEGDTIVRFSGLSEHLNVSDVLASTTFISNGIRKTKFKTGLEEVDVKFNSLLTELQKPDFIKQIQEFKPLLAEFYEGTDRIDATNIDFWKDPDVGRFKITNSDLSKFYDTKNPKHALLYFNIMGGGYIDTIAPTKEIAELSRVNFYIETESETQDDLADDYVSKAKAFALLTELASKADNEALLYLGWILHADTKGFGSYNRSTPKGELFKMHGEFIEGKLSNKGKRNCPATFSEAAEKWNDAKIGRPRLITEAYLKAADRLAYLNSDKEGKYTLPSGLQLGLNYVESVDVLLKPKNTKDFEELRTYVENKWSE
jgi:hypothetical protein